MRVSCFWAEFFVRVKGLKFLRSRVSGSEFVGWRGSGLKGFRVGLGLGFFFRVEVSGLRVISYKGSGLKFSFFFPRRV